MEEHRQLIWLLLLVLLQPSFTGAACKVKLELHATSVKCALTTLQTNVPLTTYMSNYVTEATKAVTIDFNLSTISTVPVGVFQAFSAVKLLRMNNVSINNIEPGALRGLTRLEELNLNHNNISEILDGTFDGPRELKTLHMIGNKLTTLKSLNGLTSLQWLDVDRNNIATIDDDAFKDTVNLQFLFMGSNKLVHLNAMLFSTTPELRTVSLLNNYIDNIPTGLFNMTNSLETVELSNNAIRSMTCSELSGWVILYSNQITSLVNCNKNISYLDVRKNNLTSLPAMLFTGSPSKIKNLDLSHNHISTVHVDAFAELHHLVTLKMNNNRITSIPAGTFRDLGEVTTLDISFNNLTHLEFGFFGGLTSLQVLHVSDNNIAMLESKVFFPLKSLTQLILDGNLLRTFDVDTMVSHLTTLESISLDRNQVWCEWLTNCIYVFTLRKITVVTGDSFKTKNVHGIYCVSDNVQRNSTDVSVNVTQSLLPTTEQPLRRKSVAPTAEIVPTPSTTVFSFTELVDVSTNTVVPAHSVEEQNVHAAVDCNKAEAFREQDEKINEILKNTHSLLVFVTVAVIILIIINLLFNMYFIKRNNIENGRNSSSSTVELLGITD